MSEPLILVDARNRRVGTADKRTIHERGLRHRAFSIFLVDAEGGLLLQRRQVSKYHSGGLWSNSCCGHPRPGERTIRAAQRRLAEELGVTTELKFGFQARYGASFPNGMKENEIVSVYFGRVPAGILPDPAEVAAIATRTLPQLKDDIRRHPEDYSYWLKYYMTRHRRELTARVQALRPRNHAGPRFAPPAPAGIATSRRARTILT